MGPAPAGGPVPPGHRARPATADDPFLGLGDLGELYRSLVQDSQLVFLAMRPDGTVAFASNAVTSVLGRDRAASLGSNIVDWLHPDDVERAVAQLTATEEEGGVPHGISRFRVRRADGGWWPMEVLGSAATDGRESYIAIAARDGRHQVFIEDVLTLLLSGVPRAEALAPVCNVIQWHEAGSHLAIGYRDEHGFSHVSTGLPAELAGGHPPFGADDPWERCRSRFGSVHGRAADLPRELGALATASVVDRFWIEPVVWSERHPPATVTIWTSAASGRPPAVHSYGMGTARYMSELILRWTEQSAELERAARLDALTGLANRRWFFHSLAAAEVGGAVLYCDLDRFKPVNDTWGHAAGDRLLRDTGRRIAGCVRGDDLVARLGGDEFAVLCPGATEEEAWAIAERIRAALCEPYTLDGGQQVTVGVSIGVAHHPARVSEQLLDGADRALGTAKAEGRATVRRAPGDRA